MFFPVVVALRSDYELGRTGFVFERQWWSTQELDSDLRHDVGGNKQGQSEIIAHLFDLAAGIFHDLYPASDKFGKSYTSLARYILKCLDNLK